MHETNTTVVDTRPVFYANVDASSSLPIGGNNVDSFNRVNSVVSTSLMTADTLEWSPVDTWNHPKIPRVEELEKAEDRNETNRTFANNFQTLETKTIQSNLRISLSVLLEVRVFAK